MNKTITIKLAFILLMLSNISNAQINTREIPVGFHHNFGYEMPTLVMPPINLEALLLEDEIEEQLGIPPRFGFVHSVNVDLLANYPKTKKN